MTLRSGLAVCLALVCAAGAARAHERTYRSAPPALADATAPAIAAACAQKGWKRGPAGHLLRDDCMGQLVREPVAARAAVRTRQLRIAVAPPQSPLADLPIEDDSGDD